MSIEAGNRLDAILEGVRQARAIASWQHSPVDDQAAQSFARATYAHYQYFGSDLVKLTPASTWQLIDHGLADCWAGDSIGRRRITRTVIHSADDWYRLEPKSASRGFRARIIEAAARVRDQVPQNVPVLATVFNPLFLAVSLAGWEVFSLHLLEARPAVEYGLNVLAADCTEVIAALSAAGVDGIFLAIQHGNASCFSIEQYRTLALPSDLQVLTDCNHLPYSMLHLHGEQLHLDLFKDQQVPFLHYDWTASGNPAPETVSRPPGCALALGPAAESFVTGNNEQIQEQIQNLEDRMADRPWLLAPGCAIPLDATVGAIEAFHAACQGSRQPPAKPERALQPLDFGGPVHVAHTPFPHPDQLVSVIHRFNDIAHRFGHRPALNDGVRCWTYADLHKQIQRLASVIASVLPPGNEPLAILLPHDGRLPLTMLAIMAAGRGYVPLDPGFPAERNRLILAEAGAGAIISESSLRETALELGVAPDRIINVENDLPVVPGDAARPANALDLAYVLYTSGSTGTPKGVYQNQRNLLHDVMQFTNAVHLNPDDRLTMLYSGSVNGAIRDIYGALLNGAELHPLSLHELGVNGVVTAIQGRGITVLHAVPTVFRLILTALRDNEKLSSIRLVYIAGDRVDHEDVAAFRQHFNEGAYLYTGIGSTENATLYRHWFIDHTTPLTEGRLPVGRELPDRPIRIIDEKGESLPVGDLGEIETTSRYMALGYWNNPELSKATFLPGLTDPKARRFRTGDLGRIRADGLLEFLGRKDQQVKIRGKRVELPEIESVLSTHPAVERAVVICHEHPPGIQRLIAYYTGKPGTDHPSASGLRAFLSRSLPDHMVPSAFLALESFPLTPTRKIDRKSLPIPEFTSDLTDYQAPGTELEKTLVAIFEEVLELPKIGIYDNFFDLGGQSLLALRAAVRIQERTGAALKLHTLFESPTVAGLAARIAAHAEPRFSTTPPNIPRTVGDSWPLSFAQQRLWMLEKLLPDIGVYNIPWAFRVRGELNTAALCEALKAVQARHPALRTHFLEKDGIPEQMIQENVDFKPLVESLQNLPPHRRETEALQRLIADASKPFDLGKAPLIRARILQLDEQMHMVGLTLHHCIADGWSLQNLARDLGLAYSAACQGLRPNWPELSVRYPDFAIWQRQILEDKSQRQLLPYWLEKLSGLEPLELPTMRPRPEQFSYQGNVLTFAVPSILVESLKDLVRSEQATLFMGLLAIFQVLLARHSGQQDFAIGTAIAGRNHSELEPLVGFFANTLVLRADLSGAPSFRELLQRVRTTTLDAYAHQNLPFEKLVEVINPPRDLGRNPLYQVMFLFQDRAALPALPGLETDTVKVSNGTAKFDLTLTLRQTQEGMEGSIEYATDIFEHDQIKRLAGHYQCLLEAVLLQPDSTVFDLPILTGTEQQQLRAWNATEAPYRSHITVLHLFQQQLNSNPDAVALEYGNHHFSYLELNRRSNRLAHQLISVYGITPGGVLGLCVSRSPDLIVGLLAILKAGCACVPLDSNYPAERLVYMLNDSKVELVLTEAGLRSHLPSTSAAQLDLATATVEGPEHDPPIRCNPEDLTYVIYTSGSTGRPKGIAMPHLALENLISWQLRQKNFSTPARTLQYAPISFDVAFQEIFSCLLSGGTLVLIDEESRRDSRVLLEILENQRIERLFLPFVALQALATAIQGSLPATLKDVITAGEQLQISKSIRAAFSNSTARLHNHYGPSETHVVTAHTLQGDVNDWPHLPPIGRPIDNVRTYVLDNHLQPLPVGVAGELCIGGRALAHGYLNQQQETSEKFIEIRVQGQLERLYRTGDQVRWQTDGNLEFLGRIDQQVKYRGFRIELGEIETALTQQADVKEAAVLLRCDQPGIPRLTAYLVAGSPAVTKDQMRKALEKRLPEYMIPTAWVMLDRFPRTPSGKLNRNALPPPEWSQPDSHGQAERQPQTATERVLINLWENLLRIEPITPDQDFFELGGHSLLAAELMSLIEKTFGRRLPLDTLWFKGATVKSFARILDTEDHAAWPRVIDLKTGNGKGPVLFCAPLAGGNLFQYYQLAKHLNPGQTVKGLQVKEIATGEAPRYSIQDIAKDCIEAMRSSQPQGPYHLTGFSAGGLIAYEMALQLRAEGQEVALLALLDTRPEPLTPDLSLYRRHLRKCAQLIRQNRQQPSNPASGVLQKDQKPVIKQVYWLTREMAQEFRAYWRWYVQWSGWRLIHQLGLARWLAPKHLSAAHRFAITTYRPKSSEVPFTLYYVKPRKIGFPSAAEVWQSRNPARMTAIEISGQHQTITREPEVIHLARILQTLIDNLNQTDNA